MKKQLLFIQGGMTFKSKKDYLDYLKNRPVKMEKKARWSGDYLDRKISKEFNVIKARMPLQDFAKYNEWKITFERYLPFLKRNDIIIGESLGGIFLAKYLSENKLPKKILSVYLVCPPFDNSLTGEDLVGGFILKSDISLLEEQSQNLYLLFSEDDDVVPASHAEKFRKKLNDAEIKIYNDKNGHFRVAEFPEIISMIKNDIKNV